METKPKITLGPFCITVTQMETTSAPMSPLGLAIEWSNSGQAINIPLFRRVLPSGSERIRFEHILFRDADLPCDLDCLDYQAIDSPGGAFLALDALFATLYRSCVVSRPIYAVLSELSAVVPLRRTVTNPISLKGLLTAEAEARGFRLNSVFQASGLIYAQIGWEEQGGSTRFHVCTTAFRTKPNGRLDEGRWVARRDVGVSEVLSDELHRLVPETMDLLSKAGIQFLRSQLTS